MEYEITIERTIHVARSFEAGSPDDAIDKARELFDEEMRTPPDYDVGWEEGDYAVKDEAGRTIVDWE